MWSTLKIAVLIFGLSIFILPKETLYAQETTECCELQATTDNCCGAQTTECHTTSTTDQPIKDNCKNECPKCHTCYMHFTMNFETIKTFSSPKSSVYVAKPLFAYQQLFSTTGFHNIWQPPKIS